MNATRPALPDDERRLEPAALRCELVTDFSRLESLAAEWERLFAATTPAGGVFQSWSWARSFWKVHGHERALCTPVVYEGPSVVGILPAAASGRTVRLLGAPYTDYNGLLCTPARGADVVRLGLTALLNASLPWRECVFEGLLAASPLVDAGHLPRSLRARHQAVLGYACPAAVNDGALFDRLSRKERLRKQENRLARRGRLSFRHVEDRHEILTRHLDAFFDMHIARQAILGVRSQFLSPDARAMLRALVAALDPARELRFSVLELDGRPLAYHFGLQHAGKYTWYLPTFDLDFWDDSPGGVLLRQALKYAHEGRLTEFDFTIGDEEYKRRFANDVRQTFTVYIDRKPKTIGVQARRVARGARDRVRRNATLVEHARKLQARLAAIRRRLRHPVALVSAAAGLLARVLVAERAIVCERRQVVPLPEGTRVTRLALRDLALLRLQYPSLDTAVEAGRRRMKQGSALYLSSVGSTDHLFWVGAPAEVREGPSLGVYRSGEFSKALAALLCALTLPGPFTIHSRYRRALERAVRESGCAVVGRLDAASPASGHAPIASGADSDVALRAAS